MYCKNCDLEIYGDSESCPLCHGKLVASECKTCESKNNACENSEKNNACESKETKLNPSYYPPKQAKHKSYSLIYYSRYTIYLAVALAVFLICLAINYCTSTDILWCYIVGAVLLYGYATVRYTLNSFSGVGTKIFWQAAFLTTIAFIVGAVFGTIQTNIDYTLPAILILAIAVQAYQLLCNRHNDSTLYVSSLLLPLIGFIPIILWGCGVATALSIAVIPCVLAVILIALDLVLGYKRIVPECKKIFHH